MDGLIEPAQAAQPPTFMSRLWSPWSLLAIIAVIIIVMAYFWLGGKKKKSKSADKTLDSELDDLVEKIENSQ